MSKSLFILSTPSQAFFVSLAANLVPKDSILILTVKKQEEEKEMLKYLSQLTWQKIHIWYIPSGNSNSEYLKAISFKIKLIQLKLRYRKIQNVFFGSYLNLYHLSIVAEFEKSNNLCLLYDGLQIISVAKARNAGNFELINYPLLHRLLGFKKPTLESIKYITPVPLYEIGEMDSYVVMKRESELKKSKEINDQLIYFIGQPLPNIGITSKEFYIKSINQLSKMFPEKKLIYIPHPREDSEIIEIIGDQFEVIKFKDIFEKEYIMAKVIPGKVCSFYSSVLLNLLYLNSESEVIAINIPESEIKYKQLRGHINVIYKYFNNIKSDKFSVIK
ncbi:hypothetical protein [Salegentibacter chungangensis]|uniref:Uncharacterized protein n=1 Tax=Salegentibacter chungangensis TaxID=1335724 RepID=A0ABW3NTW2_9FLAO